MMKTAGLVLSISLCLSVISYGSPVFAQNKNKEKVTVDGLRDEVVIMQDFIEEQQKSIGELKKQVAELGGLKASVEKLSTQVAALEKSSKASAEAMTGLEARAAGLEKRIGSVEEQLRKQRIRFNGQWRVRPEVATNMTDFNSKLDSDQNVMISHRFRLGVDVDVADWMTGRVTMQDVHVWGLRDQGSIDPSSELRLHEAYVDFVLDSDFASLRVGRQVWSFGAQRMIGAADWTQTGRSFDGADLSLKYGKYIEADLLYAVIDERNASNGTDVLFGGTYLTVPYIDGFVFDGYFLYLRDNRAGAKRNIGTLGVRAAGAMPFHPALKIDLEGTWQFGTVTEGMAGDMASKDQSHLSAAYHAELSYVIPEPTVGPEVTLFFDSASGDPNASPADPKNDKHTAFVPLFPTRHGYLGKMDIWSLTNIWDVGGRLSFKPSKVPGFRAEFELHKLALVEDLGSLPWANSNSSFLKQKRSSDLGWELDFSIFYQISDNLELATGYSVMLPGAGLEALATRVSEVEIDSETLGSTERLWDYPFGDTAHWFFMQANVTF